MKICKKCQLSQEASEFRIVKKTSNPSSSCRSCEKAYKQAYNKNSLADYFASRKPTCSIHDQWADPILGIEDEPEFVS